MIKLRHKLTKAYLNVATKKFTLKDIATARTRFDAASKNRLKLRLKSVRDTSANSIKLRVYRNDTTQAKLPVVVYFHGGGFVLGSIESHDSICRYISKYSNCVVVSVEYSLAPESPYPAPVNEGLEILKWLHNNGEKEGIDTSMVYLAGDSAGGNIALSMATNSSLHTTLKGLILIYPTLDPKLSTASMQQYATGHFLTKSMLVEFWEFYQRGRGPYKPPTDSELEGLPPVLIIAAEKDVLRDEGLGFAKRLRSLNKEVEYACYNDMLHGFVQFPKVASKKVQAFRRIATFITKHAT